MTNGVDQLVGGRYQLRKKLGEGGMGAVFHAYDRLNRHEIALKRVLTQTDEFTPGSKTGDSKSDLRTTLANEFQTLASLRHPHIISVLDYGFDENQLPYFTMSLMENPAPFVQGALDKPLDEKINLLIEMLQALAYLHRRGIIHRDLKPDNALVGSDGEVRVLDFGLATLREKKTEDDHVVGTLAYMAPEVLQGQPVTEAADLYAVGIMAYEIFAGHHPFNVTNIGLLVQDIVLTEPDLTELDVNEDLLIIIERLLVKSPDDRYQDAYEVIDDISRAIGQEAPQETVAIRESFLQAATFVGRETELSTLNSALGDATKGLGSCWLIGGESGVGKTRLLDELRTQALVRGAMVLYGQAVVSGGLSYQLWREPLRRLVLSTDITEMEASILKQIVPDIGLLLEYDVPDAPELEGEAGIQRLFNTITSVIRKQQQPLVIILEDLQWTVESLDMLRHLVPLAHEMSLMVIGNYRDDEKPELPDELPGMQLIKLERFGEDGIEKLSVSMLGTGGSDPQILQLLERETEGNVFFLVEVMRALAEDAGRLGDIGSMVLPEKVFAGGIQAVIERRLQRVPSWATELLQVAAVAGRELDLSILKAMGKDVNFENWLSICSNAAVLEVNDEQWRFAHDKLRTGLLDSLDKARRIELQRAVAETVQVVYANSLDEYASTIAAHYEKAGDSSDSAVWYARAGKHALATYANVMAENYLQKALEYWDDDLQSAESKTNVYVDLAAVYNWTGKYSLAEEVYEHVKQIGIELNNPGFKLTGLAGIVTAQIRRGDFAAAIETAGELEQVARETDGKRQLAQALQLKAWNTWRMGDVNGCIELAEEALLLYKEDDNLSGMVQCLNTLGGAQYTIGNYKLATEHFQEALRIAEEQGDRGPALALVGNLGEIAGALGDDQTALERNQEAVNIAREIGMHDAEMLYLSNVGAAHTRLEHYDESHEHLSKVIQMAENVPFGQLSETCRYFAETLLGQNDVEGALEAAQRALNLGQEVQSPEFVAAAWRVLGRVAANWPGEVIMVGEEPRMPVMCFAESERIFNENGMEGERARTLKAWADYELAHGQTAQGATRWNEARSIFQRIGAELEANRMGELE